MVNITAGTEMVSCLIFIILNMANKSFTAVLLAMVSLTITMCIEAKRCLELRGESFAK